jgi:hypothetical protein
MHHAGGMAGSVFGARAGAGGPVMQRPGLGSRNEAQAFNDMVKLIDALLAGWLVACGYKESYFV